MDLGVDEGWLIRQLRNLGLTGWELYVHSVDKYGLQSLKVNVMLNDRTDYTPHPNHLVHRSEHASMEAIKTVLATAGIPEAAKDMSLRIFQRLAETEAKLQKVPVQEVHFKEADSLTSILHIVGTALCIHQLAPKKIMASVQYDGTGMVDSLQGMFPLPVPTVADLFASRRIPFRQHTLVSGELTTPVGAAIIAELAESFGVMPGMQPIGVGYGAGDKDYTLPHLLRVVLGETLSGDNKGEGTDSLTILETNIDNITPEALGLVMERLLSSGAEEVYFVPIHLKKGCSVTVLSVLCEENAVTALERIIFTEIATIGIRRQWMQREDLIRPNLLVKSPFGHLQAKEVIMEGKAQAAVVYRDARRLAIETGTPLRKILSFSPEETLHIETT
jgi:uncharacterized protein (TIGR00299 family) protein